jgi:hypothetical protein
MDWLVNVLAGRNAVKESSTSTVESKVRLTLELHLFREKELGHKQPIDLGHEADAVVVSW